MFLIYFKMKGILILIMTSTILSGVAKAADALHVEEFKLSNGMTVWLNEDHSQPKVFGALVVKAGARDCPGTGIAHYFEHMMFKGTDKIGSLDYEKEKPLLDAISEEYDRLAKTNDDAERLKIQKHINELSIEASKYAVPNEFNHLVSRFGGANLNAGTSYDFTEFHNLFPSMYLKQWAELYSERLLNPVFRLFQSELETVYEEKNMMADSYQRTALFKVLEKFFEGTPYAESIIGTTENLKNPQLSKMREFYDKYYVAGNMCLMLIGDIDAEKVKPLLEATFGRVRAGEAPKKDPMTFQKLNPGNTIGIKMPVPMVKIAARVYRAPKENHPDTPVLNLAMALLANENETGLLDSLRHRHKVYLAMAQRTAMREGGALIIGVVPNIPFGSKHIAMRLCDRQIKKLQNGDFDEEKLEALKREAERQALLSMEDIQQRALAMIMAYGQSGLTWDEYLNNIRSIKNITKADIMRVAKKYLADEYMSLKKKYGSYAKDKVSQPGYTPISPKNTDKASEYAKKLELTAESSFNPRLLDLNNDATEIKLGKLAKLYMVKNPIDSLFRLEIIYHKGTNADRRLQAMASIMSMSGTEKMSHSEFGQALQNLGASFTIIAKPDRVTLTVNGYDDAFEPTMKILHEFLAAPKADESRMKDVKNDTKLAIKMLKKDNSSVADAVMEKVVYGENSVYLSRSSLDEIKKMKGSQLADIFNELQHTETSIVYSGMIDAENVERVMRSTVDIDAVNVPHEKVVRPVMNYSQPLLYVYDIPKSRQTIVGTFTPLPAVSDGFKRSVQLTWAQYFGRGMSSLMFQEIRELRSLAYYAHGWGIMLPFDSFPESATGFCTMMGTQADKTDVAMATLDNLFEAMPLRENNIAIAKREVINSINNNYPTFRKRGSEVAVDKVQGYVNSPSGYYVKHAKDVQPSDVASFFGEEIKGRTRVTMIIGDKKKLDMRKLQKYGSVVELKEKDIVR